MRAMILAAGRGSRLAPLTDHCPKPLVSFEGRPLIEHHLRRLKDIGITEVIINTHYLSDQIIDRLGSGAAFGLSIRYSVEDPLLETGGGIYKALPLLGSDPFLLMSGDVLSDYPLSIAMDHFQRAQKPCFVMLVPNPSWLSQGDFSLHPSVSALESFDPGACIPVIPGGEYTFGNISIIHPHLIQEAASSYPGSDYPFFKLGPILLQAAARGDVMGSIHRGFWHNIGTISDLKQAQKEAASRGGLCRLECMHG